MRKYTLALLSLLVGCASETTSADDASMDAASSDVASMDRSAPMDAAGEAAMEAGMMDAGMEAAALDGGSDASIQCSTAGDCRLFSSYCSTAPCMCFALKKGDPDPMCMGSMVTCFIDPCMKKTAACSDAGMCVVFP
jgi:hypothetical protein